MSNLLKDASILLTPTGYDNGRMNTIKPSKDLFGSELITSFTNGTTFPLNTFVSSGNNITSLIKSNGFGGCVSNGNSYTANDKAIVSFTYTKNSGNDLRVLFSSVVTGAGVSVSNIENISESGDYTLYFTISSATTAYLQFGTGSGSASINGSITNVSAKKDLSGDFTFVRNSAATRVNAQGLVENVQIISSELVTNGDFSQIGTEEVTNGNFSQIGSEEVTNGNFSQEGTEQITNGNFSNGSTDWNLVRGNVIDNKAVFNTTSAPSGSRSVFAIQNNVADLNKIYKVQFTISNYVSGQFRLRQPFITTDTFGNGTYTYYGTAIEVNLHLQGRLDIEHNFSIDNVSVKEVLQDWTVLDYGAIAASASLSLDNGAVKILKTADRDWRSSFLNQSISYTNGSQYKVTFKIKDGNLTSPNIYLRNAFNQSSNTIKANVPITSTFVEHTYYFTANSSSTDISIGNLDWNNQGIGEFFFVDDFSVKEVLQDWGAKGGTMTLSDSGALLFDNSSGNGLSLIHI